MTALEELPAKITTLESRVGALESQVSQFRDETRIEFSEIRDLIDKRFDEARRHALVLHEAVIEQIKVMGEGDTRRHRPPRKRR